MRISVIIPAYNEAATIAATIGDVQQYFRDRSQDYEIIVVAEGTDETANIVARAAASDSRIALVTTEKRRGKGDAVRRGVLQSTGDLVGYIDADGKTPIGDLDKLLPWLTSGYDVAVGSRAAEGAVILRRQPWHRRFGSTVFGVYLHVLLGLREIPDTQCGFKFFRRDVARQLFQDLTIRGYMFDVELLCSCLQREARIKQVGVRWADDRDSRLRLVRGNVRNFFDVLRLALRYRLIGRRRLALARVE